MSRKLILIGVLSLILAPGAALSLGLGEIRLNSYLNQPLDAEINLSISSPEERDSLRVAMAPAEAFARYGLTRPAYFDDIEFEVRASGPSAATIVVSSSRPIVEPFVTFLVQASWNGGQILREYTVLLDPPVFLPAPEPQAAPAPAVEAPRPAPEAVSRPAPTPPPVAAPAPVRPAYAAQYGTEYGAVQRNETLWGIAQRVRPDASLSTNQVMVALYNANPEAFDGNINRLRAGAILRVPDRDTMAATSAQQATAEVRRQNQAWNAATATATAAPPQERRLELAPPAETAPEPATGRAADAAPAAPTGLPAGSAGADPVLEAVESLRGELAETRRLVDLKDDEIAALQARLAELEAGAPADGGTAAAPDEAAPVAEPPVATEPGTEPGTVPGEEPAAEAAAEPVAAAVAEAEEAEAEPEPAEVATPAPAQPAPSLTDRIMGWLGNLWLWVVLAAVLIVGAIGVFLRKRQEDTRSIEDELAETGTWGAIEPTGGQLGVGGAAATAPKITPREPTARSQIEVEESVPEPAPADSRAAEPEAAQAAKAERDASAPASDEYQYPFEDTIASEAGINLDQSDPLAEADFHMAYGLYDQAAEIMKKAIAHEPDRYDLKRKLIDICFVWGNADEFLAQAHAIRDAGGPQAEADWPKIAIMGRQICPGESMFEGGDDVAVDLDLGGDDSAAAETPDTATSGSWLDFDIGAAEGEGAGDEVFIPTPDDTQEQRALSGGEVEQTAELDLDELGIDLDLGESGEYALQDLAERAPDFPDESPAEDEAKAPAGAGAAGDEDEGTMMMETAVLPLGEEDPTRRGEGVEFESESDEPTLSGETALQFEDDGDKTQVKVGPHVADDDEPTIMGLESRLEDEEAEQTMIRKVENLGDETIEAPVQEEDLDLDELTQVLEAETGKGDDFSAEADATQVAVGFSGRSESDVEATAAMEELDEVGTKLDLARAYIDMGDPDGARSILEEVADEGTEAQQEEARQLLDSLG
jgi:pilus assembly protein FimV